MKNKHQKRAEREQKRKQKNKLAANANDETCLGVDEDVYYSGSDYEFDAEETTNVVPEDVRRKYGNAMESDEFGNAVEYRELSREEAKAKEVEQKRASWIDAHKINLAQGVPLVSLQDDINRIQGQNFVCVSFIFSESYSTLHCGERLYRGDLVKVRGVFRTRENAHRFITETLQKNDPHTKVYLLHMYRWQVIEDHIVDDEDVTEEEKAAMIDSMLRGYFENENIRMSEMQKRINMVKRSKNRRKAKSNWDYVDQALKEREQEHMQNLTDAVHFQRNHDNVLTLNDIQRDFQGAVATEAPIIEITEDAVKIPGQQWACISTIMPKDYKSRCFPNNDKQRPLIKIRGIFSSREDAEKHIRMSILALDSSIDVDLIPTFRWAGLEDDCVKEREYTNDDINATIKGYFANNNDKHYTTPQDRVREARRRQEDGLLKLGMSKAHLPFDAQIMPALPKSKIDVANLRALENHNINYAQIREALNEPTPEEDPNAYKVTVMGSMLRQTANGDRMILEQPKQDIIIPDATTSNTQKNTDELFKNLFS